MIIEFADQAYQRPSYGVWSNRLVNFFVEKAVGSPTIRLPRPGLSASYSVGAGPVRGIYQQAGVFDGDKFTVSGTGVYREASLIGAVAGSGVARFAASASQLVIVTGGVAYVYDGSTFTTISDTDLPEVSDVATLAGRFIYTQLDSDRFYWSAVNDATTIDGLDFATAEGSPDATVCMAVLADELFFYGSASTEIWFPTGDLDAPYQRTQGRRYTRGCAAQSSVVQMDNTLIFVGDDRVVYRSESAPRRISEHGIEESLRRCTDLGSATAFLASFDGHPFYVLNIPGEGSYTYDVSTGTWAEWSSYGRTTFRAQCAVIDGGVAYLGDADNGQVWVLSSEAYQDGDDPITGYVSAVAPVNSGVLFHYNMGLNCTRGVGNADQPAPVVEMRYSDDGGRLWTNWISASLGGVGRYEVKAIWKRLGKVKAPGRVFEFRITDPVLKVVRNLVVNEQRL